MAIAEEASLRRMTSVRRTVGAFGFLAIATQRIGFEIGGGTVALDTLLMLGMIIWLLARARVRIVPTGIVLFIALGVSAAVSTLAATVPSVASGVLLLATYAVVLLEPRDPYSAGRSFLNGAVIAITIGAVSSLVQYFAQQLGRGYFDPIGLLPSAFLRTGFNTYYDLQYFGGYAGQYKPNGVIFLEPSLLSLFTAIAIVYVATLLFRRDRRRTGWLVVWMLLLAGSFAVSASASGFVVLGAAAVPLLWSARRNIWALIVVAGSAGALLQFGVFDAVIKKLNEGTGTYSSTALRLTLPYEMLAPFWRQAPIIGHGPGAATVFIESLGIAGLQASTVMKLLVEYGIIGAFIMALIVIRAVRTFSAPIAIVVALLAAWLVPAEALLNATLVTMVLFVIPHWEPMNSREPRDASTRFAPPSPPTRASHAARTTPPGQSTSPD